MGSKEGEEIWRKIIASKISIQLDKDALGELEEICLGAPYLKNKKEQPDKLPCRVTFPILNNIKCLQDLSLNVYGHIPHDVEFEITLDGGIYHLRGDGYGDHGSSYGSGRLWISPSYTKKFEKLLKTILGVKEINYGL